MTKKAKDGPDIGAAGTQSVGRWVRSYSASCYLRLSGADRHLKRLKVVPTAPAKRPHSVRPGPTGVRTLSFLQRSIRQLRAEQESPEAAMSTMKELGRKTNELLTILRIHFNQGPSSNGLFDYSLVYRNLLGDVGRWIQQHFVPLAASRSRALTTSIDPRLEMLPAHVVFSLLIEHLRKRIYDSELGSRLNLDIKLIDDHASIRLTEVGNEVPPIPITDDATRRLWVRVVRQLGGSMSWSRLSNSPALNPSTTCGSEIQIDYPVFSSRMFRLDRDPLTPCRWIPNSSAA